MEITSYDREMAEQVDEELWKKKVVDWDSAGPDQGPESVERLTSSELAERYPKIWEALDEGRNSHLKTSRRFEPITYEVKLI